MSGLLAAALVCPVASGAPFKVGFVGGKHHAEEFSSVPSAFFEDGWEFHSYIETEAKPGETVKAELLADLGKLDLVAVQPLAPDVFAGEDAAWKAFLDRGGAIVVTDSNYPDKYVWTDFLGPDYRHPDGEGFAGWYPAWVDKFNPEPPVRTFPRTQVDGGILWYHFNMSNAGKAWKPLLKCARHKQPCAVQAAYGKGMVYLTNLRCPYASFFENLRAAAELRRNGLEMVSAEGGALTNAQTTLSFAVQSDDGTALSAMKYQALLEITSATNEAQKVRVVARGQSSGKAVAYKLNVLNGVRGPGRVRLALVDARTKSAIVLIDRRQTFDDVVELEMPRYRSMVSTARRVPAVSFAFRLNPLPNDKLSRVFWLAKVLDAEGKVVAAFPKSRPFVGTRLAFSLPVPADAPAGDYTLRVEVASALTQRRFVKTAPFKILAPAETQVVVDQDNALLRNGKPWFPLGIYHAQPQYWEEVRDLGIDLQQSMNWLDGEFPRLAAMKQSLLYENKHRWPENLAHWAKHFSTEPFACMWYVVDEPFDDLVWRWEACSRAMAAADPNHPTYTVLLYPASFHYQRNVADLLAVDTYPLDKDGRGDIVSVATRIDLLRDAIGDSKPILAVLQSFGHEPLDKFRVMAYLAVVHGVKGILWYPWEEGDPAIGVNTNPALKEEMRKVIAEIRALAPALLSGNAKMLKFADGKVHAMLCGNKATGVKLICVNPTESDVQVSNAMKGAPASFKVPALGVVVF
ncbi:MAG: hypothetical protein IJQ73_01285 [Kiritimatiellae bacterium]|nr:hypothetical protein [Kiritimatiellia bacterium]